MILLGIDTCGITSTLALARLVGESLEPIGAAELAGRTAAAGLVPALEQMLKEGEVARADIAAIVVVDGPGSFTGIRIGLSTAKALAQALRRPLYAVSRLRVLASRPDADGAVLDAGRGEFYIYTGSHGRRGRAEDEDEEWLLTCEDLTREDSESAVAPARLTGLSFDRLVACEVGVAAALKGVRMVAEPNALDAMEVALPDVLAGRASNLAALDGRYVRRSNLYRTTLPGSA